MTTHKSSVSVLDTLIAAHERDLAARLEAGGTLVAFEAVSVLRAFRATAAAYVEALAQRPIPSEIDPAFAERFLATQLAREAAVLADGAERRADARRASCAGVWQAAVAAEVSRIRRAAFHTGGAA